MMNPTQLGSTGLTDVTEFIALRRVSCGSLTRRHNSYFDHGRPVACYLPAVLDLLGELGLVEFAPPDPWGLNRAHLTTAGLLRYLELKLTHRHRPAP